MNQDRNVLTLAYLGDSVYELYVRKYLVLKGIVKVKELQAASISYVSANSQCKYLKELMNQSFFTEEELDVIARGRNHKGCRHPKNTDIVTYKYATGFEALIGFLYLEGRIDRIQEIMKEIIGEEYVYMW